MVSLTCPRLPGIWHEVHESVVHPTADSIAPCLIELCSRAHSDLVTWFRQYETYCAETSLVIPTAEDLAKRRELLGIALECLAVVKRLLATVYIQQSATLEKQAQQMAVGIMNLQNDSSPIYSWLFSSHEIGVAQSIITTKDLWALNLTDHIEWQAVARNRYLVWDSVLRGT